LAGASGFQTWHSRIENGLARMIERSSLPGQSDRYRELLEKSRHLLRLNAPLARLFNSLGELSLRAGFQILSIVLLRRAEKLNPRDPLPGINLSRTELSLANRFLLRAPASGAAAYNLRNGGSRLQSLLKRGTLPDSRQAETTLLLRRIEDRLELCKDLRKGEITEGKIREILLREDHELRPLLGAGKLPSLAELEKLEPRRAGFYYREYREEQRRLRERRLLH
jgi:hypothetical protein